MSFIICLLINVLWAAVGRRVVGDVVTKAHRSRSDAFFRKTISQFGSGSALVRRYNNHVGVEQVCQSGSVLDY
jgi:hypothetical protein